MNDDTEEFLQVGNYKIEKGIPFPESRNREVMAKVRRMTVGDSIQFKPEQRGAFESAKARTSGKFKIRRISPKQCRIWRLE
jgi:hypothetical protein